MSQIPPRMLRLRSQRNMHLTEMHTILPRHTPVLTATLRDLEEPTETYSVFSLENLGGHVRVPLIAQYEV